jgi:hypothetical protein
VTPAEAELDAARSRQVRTRRWTMLALAGVALVTAVVVAVVITPWAGVMTGVILLGSVALAWALPGRPRGPQYPAERHAAFAALDADQTTRLIASHGEVAAVRDVRRQLPWATLNEVVTYVRSQAQDAGGVSRT